MRAHGMLTHPDPRVGGSAGQYRPDHHQRKDHEQQDQAQFGVIRHAVLRSFLGRKHKLPGEGRRVTLIT